MVFQARFSLLGHYKKSYGNFRKKILTSYSLPCFVSSEFPNQSSILWKIFRSPFQLQTRTPHIEIRSSECLNSLNIILKYLSHPHTGCNRKLFLQSYNSLIRSRLDYGALIFSHTHKTSLKLLDSIQSSALRMALVALRTSPTPVYALR